MKKILAIALAILMVVSLAACNKANNTNNNTPGNNNVTGNDPAIEKFVNENRAELLSTMESSFTQGSGLTCKSSVRVEGKGFIMSININELTNVDDATKQQMQSSFDGMSDYFGQLLDQMRTELPTLQYYQVDVCDKDGNILATVKASK